jgi:hypothetical protein
MKRVSLALFLLGASASALATGRLADVSIVDRATGATLTAHYHRGEYWVAGRPGARYAVRIASRSGERLLAVTAVDGVNAISGDTAAYGQTGYVFSPWQAYDIAGWRKSDDEVAAFVFTAAPTSYAARTGRPFNIGVIGVALFRERLPEPLPLRADSAAAPAMPAPSGSARLSESMSEPRAAAKLGTGHGEREYSSVQRTDFERRSSQPDEIIRIRYDSHDNLVAMGIIRSRPPRDRVPEAFPDSPLARYVPDPPLR